MRDRIIQVAMEKINQYGFRKFTIDQIASQLGISKKTVYKYFKSKNDIIASVVDKYIDLEKEGTLSSMETEGTWSDKLQTVFFSFAPDKPTWVSEELQRFFPREWAKVENMRRWRADQIKELFSKALKSGEIRNDINPAIIEIVVLSTMEALFDFNNLKQMDITFKQALGEFKKVLFKGILIDKM